MSATEEKVLPRCEKCDRETAQLIKLTAPDNTVRHVCWSCFARGEKRFNLRETWRRERRSR